MAGVSEDERRRVAQELRRIRDLVRDRPLPERSAAELLPPALAPRQPAPVPSEPLSAEPPSPPRPDGGPVNAAWNVGQTPAPGGIRGLLARLVRRLIGPLVEAQVTFNSRQVQLDNALLEYLDVRLAATHRHYDEVLGIHGRHMQEIDERHLILQEELVAHVHDLVRRIDLVLGESERGRLGVEVALKDLRRQLQEIERHLGRG
jgi:hypothetical protein